MTDSPSFLDVPAENDPRNVADDLDLVELGLIVDSTLIPHSAYQRASKSLEQVLRYAGRGSKAVCLSIIGESRTGKTRALQELVIANPAIRDAAGLTVPILYVVTPAKPSAKNLAETMLYELGDPLWDKGIESQKTTRLRILLKATGVLMIVIDEFQHFYDKTSRKVWHHVANWLKSLVELTGVSLVTAGLPQCRIVINQNEQLAGRSLAPITMPRFTWRDPDLREEFKAILGAFNDVIAERVDIPNLASDDMAFRIWCATGGLMGYVIKFLRLLLQNANDDDASVISLHDFKRAYQGALREFDPSAPSPQPFDPGFCAAPNEALYNSVLSIGVSVDVVEDEKPRRSKKRKGASESLGNVLRT